jgi:hypothetical protein
VLETKDCEAMEEEIERVFSLEKLKLNEATRGSRMM